MINRVLLIDDDKEVRDALSQSLSLADLAPQVCGSFIEAKDHLSPDFQGVVVSDIRMPGRDGFHLLSYAKSVDEDLPVILLTGEADVPMAVQGMSEGAFAFLEKPCAPADLIQKVETALAQRRIALNARRQRHILDSGDAAARMLIGSSALSEALRDRVRAVAKTSAEVLVNGAPGSGTPKVAEVIHLLSPVARHPFIKRSGGALDMEGLRDAIYQAGKGSLFIDEVGALPMPLQFSLLDVLETGTDARLIAGTTKQLKSQIEDGSFSAELFYRLDMMNVYIPSLKERPEDIPVMFQHYVAQACEQAALPQPEIKPETLAAIMAQEWPGNARSLMSAAMRFSLGIEDTGTTQELGLAEQMSAVERSLLISALRKHGGHATATATALKLPRKTFYDKLARHGLRAEDYRS